MTRFIIAAFLLSFITFAFSIGVVTLFEGAIKDGFLLSLLKTIGTWSFRIAIALAITVGVMLLVL